ncbi:DUF998 domain-containing protein [Halorarum halobium]|uniref:DUF998 domain-containing protein n=1 Tax=Halorarum halobium TaxID=3075121 RepID=UPI0028AE743C|nr:DUF998 domain-containing protein [Halobaculum sp. XH14]
MTRPRSWLSVAGVAGPTVLLAAFALAAAASPEFDGPTDPFSVAGAGEGVVAVAFNAGLVLGGLLALAFVPWLREEYGRVVALAYGLVAASFAAAGVFPVGSGLHWVAAVAFVGAPVVLLAAAVVDWRAGRPRIAVLVAGLGAVSLGVWLPYDLQMASLQIGYAVAEFLSVAALAAWGGLCAGSLRGADGEPSSADR